MSNGSDDPTSAEQAGTDMSMDSGDIVEKGKGKATVPEDIMDEDDSEESSEDEVVSMLSWRAAIGA